MKLLFDQNISFRIKRTLIDQFPDCIHVSDCGLVDSTDNEIWEYARDNDYSIVSFDSDFYDYSVLKGSPPHIILIRSDNQTTTNVAKLLLEHSDSIAAFVRQSSFSCLHIRD